MRNCAACKKADAPWFERAPCSCGAAKLAEEFDDPSPGRHLEDCDAIGHEVVLYPVRIAKTELVFNGAVHVLGSYYAARGWVLMQNGPRYYRTKMLCRGCIDLEDLAQERKLDYEKACRLARGLDDQTYAQMLAQQ